MCLIPSFNLHFSTFLQNFVSCYYQYRRRLESSCIAQRADDAAHNINTQNFERMKNVN